MGIWDTLRVLLARKPAAPAPAPLPTGPSPDLLACNAKVSGLAMDLADAKDKLTHEQSVNQQLEHSMQDLQNQVAALQAANLSDVDTFCMRTYTQVPNKAYLNKRKVSDIQGDVVYYTMFINEFIMYDDWEVENLLHYMTTPTTDTFRNARNIGNRISQLLVWDDDKNLDRSGDYYLLPSETLSRHRGDCEDHAFATASCNKEFGVAYGFLVRSDGSMGGHAFNTFIVDNALWVLDTVGDSAVTVPYVQDTCGYRIHFIITKTATYEVLGGVEFGELAGWVTP